MDQPPILYVRHAMAAADDSRHPTEWVLDDEGRGAASDLADRLEVADGIGVLVSSTEPKALGTAEVIATRWGAEVTSDERLREATRPWVGPGYRAVAHRYLRGETIDGWEQQAVVAARADEAVHDAVKAADGRTVVVVTHGLVLATLLCRILGDDFDAESFWSCLAFPDAWALDDSGLLHRPLGSFDTGQVAAIQSTTVGGRTQERPTGT
ncbi:MAG TPA: histidine phosphatase family protein [Acidimicrobiales bacterium]